MSPEALSGGTSNRVARVRWFYNDWFFLSLYFLSLLFKIHAGPTKIKSYTLIFFISIVVLIFLIALYLFWIFFIPYHLVLFEFYIKFGSHSFDCYFLYIYIYIYFSWLNLFFNFIPRHFMSFYFYIIYGRYSFNCSFFLGFLFWNWFSFSF